MVNSELDLEHIAQHVVAIATRLIGAERGSLFLLDPSKATLSSLVAQGLKAGALTLGVGDGIVGAVAATGRSILLDHPYEDPRFDPQVDHATGFTTRSLLTVPVKDRDGVLVAVLQLLNKKRGVFGRDDVKFLAELGASFALALTTATLHREIVARERMSKELQLAADIQRTLQPGDLSAVPGLALEVVFRPCLEVGGDYFDCIPRDDGSWWLVVADVSGKGVSSALVASNLQAYFWSRRNDPRDVTVVVGDGNDLLHRLAHGRKYATLLLAQWTPSTKEFALVNAGHPPAMLLREGSVERMDATGAPIGLIPRLPYGVKRYTLSTGDGFLFYTDGVSEAGEGTPSGEFGLDRVEAVMQDLAPDAAPLQDLIEEVERHLRGAPLTDDVTLLFARVET